MHTPIKMTKNKNVVSDDDRAEGYGPARNSHAAAMQRAVEQARPQNVDFPVEEQNGQREGGRGGKKKGHKGMLPSFVTAAGVEASKAFVAILRNFNQTFAEQKQAFDAWGEQYNATEQVTEWYQNITTKADATTQDIIAKMATVLQKMQELKDANPEMTIAEYFEAVKAWVNSTDDENTKAAARWVMMIRGESLGFGEKRHKMGGHSHGGDSHEWTEDDRAGEERNGSGGHRDRGQHRFMRM
ncbi:hypothetical protein WR25_19377 [Diploscapter pachys]|uniref:SXP/RAL-2 family protein Ani s 5-like cation-binding domain-containing protein n=1 Tax=Diploscapter pachys TaxID=2018661 RepID=A0A2A2KEZ4_9BILA|nr:hypothetical protein WR25_19377 [Diploscapter pachys]